MLKLPFYQIVHKQNSFSIAIDIKTNKELFGHLASTDLSFLQTVVKKITLPPSLDSTASWLKLYK